ncbi:DUF3153 domain-containing protein [Prochlorococcus sp. MIT 1300]|uniref:DUF3153 domain-containing protein n=1 Tax=Prochlorococcus sp. MIT 1300 TaxID=3096218 RepID=UPI002A74EE80|nr:DUF3153 domain-containing protein [Prochlorococcus sp. MIT 1300]
MKNELAKAEKALACGDYGQVLSLLEPLTKVYPPKQEEGAKIRIMIVTALMGLGQEQKAIKIVRQLTHGKNPELRQLAKQLLEVLEAPSLPRPSNWSIDLPALDLEETNISYQKNNARFTNKTNKNLPPLPPTGPTKGMDLGFTFLALTILISLTFLLSGCVQIQTRLSIPGPNRVSLDWEIQTSSQQILPWQKKLKESLNSSVSGLKIQEQSRGLQKIYSPILQSKDANILLQEVFKVATEEAGIELPPPELVLNEKNWLIGVEQKLILLIDLKDMPKIPGINLSIVIDSNSSKNIKAKPKLTAQDNKFLRWDIQPGALNQLELKRWQWSGLGIGTFLIFGLLSLALILQSIRLKLGFGFPELPA